MNYLQLHHYNAAPACVCALCICACVCAPYVHVYPMCLRLYHCLCLCLCSSVYCRHQPRHERQHQPGHRDPRTCAAPAGNAPTTPTTRPTTPTTTPPNPTSKPTRKFKGAAVKRQRTTDLWAGPLRVALDTHFAEEAVDAKRTALEKVLEEMPVLPVEGELEGASDVRYFRAMNKVAGDPFDFPRVAALHKMLIAISSKTVQAALRGDLLDDFVFRTEKKLIFNIQESYDTHTCLNLKLKNLMGREKWNRLRLLLSSIFVDGTWRRKLVGESQLPVPMLPEARTLLTLQREIEEEFGMSLDGDMEGKSVKACLNACLVADCKYAQGQGFLEPAGEEFEGALPALVQSCNKRGLCVQFKMDACQSWKGVKQTAIAYRFPRASKTAGSPFDTSEIALFEGGSKATTTGIRLRSTRVELFVPSTDTSKIRCWRLTGTRPPLTFAQAAICPMGTTCSASRPARDPVLACGAK